MGTGRRAGTVSDRFEFRPAEHGPLRIWKQPDPGRVYVIGVDVAEGVAGGDNSVAAVLDAETMEQCAEWCGNIEPYEFAEEVVNLAKWYGDALTAIEINNHGLAVVNRVRDLGYWNLYNRRQFDTVQRAWVNRLGWQTSVRTKPLLIDHARNVLREGEAVIYSMDLAEEMSTYVLDDAGRANAQAGKHDDRVMAWMIALQCREMVFEAGLHLSEKKKSSPDAWVWDKVRQLDKDAAREKRSESYEAF